MRTSLLTLTLLLAATRAHAQYGQPQPPLQAGVGAQPPTYVPSYVTQRPSANRSSTEIGALYVTSVVYGVGAGIWFDSELKLTDPALALIAPAVLGVAAPAGVFAADNASTMRRGLPAAIAAGAIIGAGEGIGLSSLQFVRANEEDAWGFRGLSRATALGATLGAGGGLAFGYLQSPSPRSSVFVTSGVFWGSAVGSMLGYGASPKGVGYGRANDDVGLGGFIGYNVGLVATGALSMVYIPTTTALEWMWAGAGLGFTASLPVFLLYAGSDSPAKRGFVFSAVATTLGLAAGGVFTAGTTESYASRARPSLARLTTVAPLAMPGAVGLTFAGELE